MREEIFASLTLRVVRGAGDRSGPVVVTFEPYADFPSLDRAGFGAAFFAQQGIEAFHVIPARNDWYQDADMPAALAVIRAAVGEGRRLATYGSSMGGYAAYRFSGRLRADVVLACSPQYSVDPARVPWEKRWKRAAEGLRFPFDAEPVRREAMAYLFYDPRTADRRHARLIGREMPVCHVRLPHAGHPCLPLLREMGLLGPTVEAVVRGTFDPQALEAEVRERSDRSPRYLMHKALALPRVLRGRRVRLLDRALALAPDDPWVSLTYGWVLASHRDWDKADARFRKALALSPDDPSLLYVYRRFLERAGRHAEALAVQEAIVHRFPEAIAHVAELDRVRAQQARKGLLKRLIAALPGRGSHTARP
ncbi:tetratricopeptide repeat protein [Azorhizobium sp. AG788]|uniref:tetratricopeptide repeat protein n=1 Tax=Azorhizobium sp. AG788 TaxID=2183897 RepID=UPI00105F6C74|nr:tetratricopeptide repeat protein [Azorhizobium sp. AG788]